VVEAVYSQTVIDGKERPKEGVFFRISIDQITGHIGIEQWLPSLGAGRPGTFESGLIYVKVPTRAS
jgi:hypothetical protein